MQSLKVISACLKCSFNCFPYFIASPSPSEEQRISKSHKFDEANKLTLPLATPFELLHHNFNHMWSGSDFNLRIKLEHYDGRVKFPREEEVKELKRKSNLSLTKEIGSLLGSTSLSDFKIQTKDGSAFDVHRLILKGALNIILHFARLILGF
jgi:hypothetical protein